MKLRLSFASLLLLGVGIPLAAQTDPATLPARDRHDGLLIAADPYKEAPRAKERFGKPNPVEAGVLPVDVYLRNETSEPIRVNLEAIRLDMEWPGEDRQSLEPLSAQDAAQTIAYPGGNPRAGTGRRLPIPIPLPTHDKKRDKIADALRPLMLETSVIAPHQTAHGFLFFNLGRDFTQLSRASLYVPDVKIITQNKALMYFEIPLGLSPAR